MPRSAAVVRSRLWLVAVVLAASAAPVLGATAACAGTTDRAALVVDTGAGAFTYCVELSDDPVSGLELIQLANDQHGLQYRFGDGGQAVCMLANVGAEGEDCFGEYPDFWGFWRGDGNGGWTWSSVGAGSTLVKDGDIQGWSWGSGQDGSTHPKPPPTRHGDVCKPMPAPQPEKQRERRSATSSGGSTGSDDAAGTTVAPKTGASEQRKAGGRTEEPPQKSEVAKQRRTPRTATASGRTPGAVTRVTDEAASALEEETPGLPTTGIVAIALVAALGAGGALAMRRRKN